jgi:hypothetical protein
VGAGEWGLAAPNLAEPEVVKAVRTAQKGGPPALVNCAKQSVRHRLDRAVTPPIGRTVDLPARLSQRRRFEDRSNAGSMACGRFEVFCTTVAICGATVAIGPVKDTKKVSSRGVFVDGRSKSESPRDDH